MFTRPAGDLVAAATAAERAQDLFLEIVAECVGPAQARQYGGLLLTSAHGITDLKLSGHLVLTDGTPALKTSSTSRSDCHFVRVG